MSASTPIHPETAVKYECDPTYCLPIPILEDTDLPLADQKHIPLINEARRHPISPAAFSPAIKRSTSQGKKFDQFWEGTDSITVPGTPGEVGRLFVTSNTTSTPASGPATIDTWVEDWVIVNWPAFNGSPTTTVSFSNIPGTADQYILGQPPGTVIKRMTLSFQYQNQLPSGSNIPGSLYNNRKIIQVASTQSPGVLAGYLYREFSGNGHARQELWVLLNNYIFPSVLGEGTQLSAPLPGNPFGGVTTPAAFFTAITGQALPIAYYVFSAGVFAPV